MFAKVVNLPVLASLHALRTPAAAEEYLEGHGHSCGGCRACCTTHRTVSPAWEACPHECAGGCAVYATRPAECRSYACLYRSGALVGDERRRPDNLGLIFEAGRSAGVGDYLVAWEVAAGSAGWPQADWLVRQLARQCLVVLQPWAGGPPVIHGPEHQATAWLSENGLSLQCA